MGRYVSFIFAAVLAELLGSPLAAAQEDAIARLPLALLHRLQPQTTRADFEAAMVELTGFHGRNPGGDFNITETLGLWRAAQARAYAVAPVLEYDVDGDFLVTAAEIRYVVEFNNASPSLHPPSDVASVIADTMKLDRNGDGKVTLAEIITGEQAVHGVADYGLIYALMALDPDKDGKLTGDELRGIADGAYAAADKDGDGTLSAAEADAAQAIAVAPLHCTPKRSVSTCEER